MNKKYDYNDYCWTLVTDEAKDFINKLLEPNPEKRMTVEESLNHPWIKRDKNKQRNINIREHFNAKLIYKKAFDKLKIIQGFNHSLEKCSSVNSEDTEV